MIIDMQGDAYYSTMFVDSGSHHMDFSFFAPVSIEILKFQLGILRTVKLELSC